MSEIRLKSTGTIKLFENDNTSNVTIASPASLGADRTITLPDANVTLASGTMNDATNLSGTVPIANGGTASTSTTYCDLAANVTGNLPVANLNSGTSASSSTFWRGDGTWVAAGGTNTPYFLAYCSGNQTGIGDNATVDVEFDSEIYDSAGEFDTTTYKWTPTTAGYYWIEAQVYYSCPGDLNETRLYIDVSGTLKFYQAFSNYDAPFNYGAFKAGGIYYLSGSNYVDVRAGADTNGTTWDRGGSGTSYMTSYFQGWKLIT
jgi:hypothetical protein